MNVTIHVALSLDTVDDPLISPNGPVVHVKQNLRFVAPALKSLVQVLDQARASRIFAPRRVYTLCNVCVQFSAVQSTFN